MSGDIDMADAPDLDDEAVMGAQLPAAEVGEITGPLVIGKPFFDEMPIEIKLKILEYCVESPDFADNPADALVGPTISQKGEITDQGRNWKNQQMKPAVRVAGVCREFRDIAAFLLAQVNIFKIKYPHRAFSFFVEMDPSCLAHLRRLDLTLTTIDGSYKEHKYRALSDFRLYIRWTRFLWMLRGIPLKEVRINFAELNSNGTGWQRPFFRALRDLDISKTLIFDGVYPKFGVDMVVPALTARNPQMEFRGEGTDII